MRNKKLIVFFTMILMITLACSLSGGDDAGAITVEISSPAEGATFTVGQEIHVVASVIADDGVAKAYLSVNGQIISTEEPGNLPQAHVTNFAWVPIATGDVKLTVVAIDGNDQTSEPVSVNVKVENGPGGSAGTGEEAGTGDSPEDSPEDSPGDAPPSDTPVPPTDTPVPPTDTPVPPTPTNTYTPHPPTPTFTDTPEPGLVITIPPIIVTLLPLLENVSGQVDIPAGDPSSKSVQCPEGSTVVGGGFAAQSGIYIYNQHMDNNGWKVFGMNSSGSSRKLTVYATCIKNLAGSSSQMVHEQISVPGNDNGHVVVSCPWGSTVVSGGWASNHNGNLWIRNSTKVDNGWQIYVTNTSGSSQLLNVYATCLNTTASISTEMVLEQDNVDNNDTDGHFTTCPSGLATGGGFAGGLNMFFYNSSPKDWQTWAGYVRNTTGSSKVYNVYAICLTLD